MPIVPFDSLPDDARVWVFASDRALDDRAAATLLDDVDRFLAQWKAHGVPLDAARDWRDEHFLAVGVDSTKENASGCSIDGLFRSLQSLERTLDTRLLGGGRVFYRDSSGTVVQTTRAELVRRAARGEIHAATPVFDLGLTRAADWRARFEQPASETWTRTLLAQPHSSGA